MIELVDFEFGMTMIERIAFAMCNSTYPVVEWECGQIKDTECQDK